MQSLKKTFQFLLIGVFSLTVFAQNPVNPYKSPLYWTVYEHNFLKEKAGVADNYIPESEWLANINWVETNLKPFGYNMICIDGWGNVDYNQYGYRTKHSSNWVHDYAWWSAELQNRGMTLGIYDNPLWVNINAANAGVKVKGTNIALSTLINTSENAKWFTWLQVDKPGAEQYVKGYIQHYADMGVKYLRVDFLSWYESGWDRYMGTVGVSRPVANYQTALRWMREACDANNMLLSLVMPHLNNDAANEQLYGHMIRINEDCAEGGWSRFSELARGVKRSGWSQYGNAFDGYIYWSKIAGRGKMILDGDFIRLNTFSNDEERKSVLSLHLMAGGPVTIADQYSTIGNSVWIYQNQELMALNADDFVGKPLSNDPTNALSQVWKGQLSNGDWVVGFFNRESTIQTRSINFQQELGITGNAYVRDLWAHTNIGTATSLSKQLGVHACQVYKISTAPIFSPQQAMYIGASFNNWNPALLPLNYIGESNWTSNPVSLTAGNYELKFTNTTNWTGQDWGNSNGLSGTAQLSTGGLPNVTFTIPTNGVYSFKFNDATLQYSIISTISTLTNPMSDKFKISNNGELFKIESVYLFSYALYDLNGRLLFGNKRPTNTVEIPNYHSSFPCLVKLVSEGKTSFIKMKL